MFGKAVEVSRNLNMHLHKLVKDKKQTVNTIQGSKNSLITN